MGVGNFLDDRETQTGSRRSKARFGSTVESFEDSLVVGPRNSRTLIADFRDDLRIAYCNVDFDRRLWDGILEGVIEKLSQYTLDEFSIAEHRKLIGRLRKMKSFPMIWLIDIS